TPNATTPIMVQITPMAVMTPPMSGSSIPTTRCHARPAPAARCEFGAPEGLRLGGGRVLVAVARPVPTAVLQVVLESDRGKRDSEVGDDDVQSIAPPRIPARAEGIQDLLEVQADLEADLPLAEILLAAGVELGAVGRREEEIPERPDVPVESAAHRRQLQVARQDLV